MNVGKSIFSGIAGAVAMTTLHNFLKDRVEDAPKIDNMGVQALKMFLGPKAPGDEKKLYQMAMASDLLSNGLVYSLTALSKNQPVLAGALIGFGIGLGTTSIPQRLGLDKDFAAKTSKTALMSVLYYMSGGVTTGALVKATR